MQQGFKNGLHQKKKKKRKINKIEWSERSKKMVFEPKSEGDDRVNLIDIEGKIVLYTKARALWQM